MSVAAGESEPETDETGYWTKSGKGVSLPMRDAWNKKAREKGVTVSHDVKGHRYFTTAEELTVSIPLAFTKVDFLKEDIKNAVKQLEEGNWSENKVNKLFSSLKDVYKRGNLPLSIGHGRGRKKRLRDTDIIAAYQSAGLPPLVRRPNKAAHLS